MTMRKARTFTLIMAFALTLSLFAACSNIGIISQENDTTINKGLATEDYTDVVAALLDRYKANDDFMALCSATLEEAAVREVMDKMIAPDCQYLIDGYANPDDYDISIAEGEYLVLFSGGKEEDSENGILFDVVNEAYAIIVKDTKTQNYIINKLEALKNRQNIAGEQTLTHTV